VCCHAYHAIAIQFYVHCETFLLIISNSQHHLVKHVHIRYIKYKLGLLITTVLLLGLLNKCGQTMFLGAFFTPVISFSMSVFVCYSHWQN
jgi:hypothetical protein